MSNKKTISPVVAIALLLVVSVVAVVGYQQWYQGYQSVLTSDVEQRSTTSGSINIEYISSDGTLYVINSGTENLTMDSLEISGSECVITNELEPGVNKVNISSCLNKTGTNDIVIVTDLGITEEKVFVEDVSYFTSTSSFVDLPSFWVNFISPTPVNDFSTPSTSFEVKVNITNVTTLQNVVYNFNGTNYSMFDNDLVFMMNFNNVASLGESYTAANSVVKDVSGNGNDGTTYNGLGGQWFNNGKYDGNLDFDGSNDYILLPSNSDFYPGTGSYAVSLWVRWDTSCTSDWCENNQIIGCRDLHGTRVVLGWQMSLFKASSGQIYFSAQLGDGAQIAKIEKPFMTSWTLPGWHNMFFVRDKGTGRVYGYFDGELIEDRVDSTGNINGCSQLMRIGYNQFNNRYLNGAVDDIRIWKRSFNASEVAQYYNSYLRKYDNDKWEFYINQKKDATNGLDSGNYSYEVYAKNSSSWGSTEKRTITIT